MSVPIEKSTTAAAAAAVAGTTTLMPFRSRRRKFMSQLRNKLVLSSSASLNLPDINGLTSNTTSTNNLMATDGYGNVAVRAISQQRITIGNNNSNSMSNSLKIAASLKSKSMHTNLSSLTHDSISPMRAFGNGSLGTFPPFSLLSATHSPSASTFKPNLANILPALSDATRLKFKELTNVSLRDVWYSRDSKLSVHAVNTNTMAGVSRLEERLEQLEQPPPLSPPKKSKSDVDDENASGDEEDDELGSMSPPAATVVAPAAVRVKGRFKRFARLIVNIRRAFPYITTPSLNPSTSTMTSHSRQTSHRTNNSTPTHRHHNAAAKHAHRRHHHHHHHHHHGDFFDKSVYKQSEERVLTSEAVHMLGLPTDERTKDVIKYLLAALNFVVPEFDDYPASIQESIVGNAFYQEIEPHKVIIRQGHRAEKYYLIVSGAALVIQMSYADKGELVRTPLKRIKRGQTFGEYAILNNSERAATVVNANKKLCLLTLEKDDFYLINDPLSQRKEKIAFIRERCPIFSKFHFPLDLIENNKRVFTAVYYRKGEMICQDSWRDDWLYLVKSGSCKMLKQIQLNQHTFDTYLERLKTRNNAQGASQTLSLNNLAAPAYHELKEQRMRKIYAKLVQTNPELETSEYVYLEIGVLTEGEMFGLEDMVSGVNRQQPTSSCILVSGQKGVELILIKREYFMSLLPSQSFLDLRLLTREYPTNDYLIEKYLKVYAEPNVTLSIS